MANDRDLTTELIIQRLDRIESKIDKLKEADLELRLKQNDQKWKTILIGIIGGTAGGAGTSALTDKGTLATIFEWLR